MKYKLLVLLFLLSAASLMASGSISGVVTTALGIPLPNATVTVLRGSNTVIATTTTTTDGSYSFSGISTGEYVVRTSLLTFQTAIAGVTIVDGQNSVANFSLAADPGELFGQVTDNSTHLPIAGAIINTIQNDILIGSATTDGSGNYTIAGLASGSYTVTGSAASYQTSVVGASVLTSQSTTVNFSLKSSPGSISGIVASADGGAPISNALIQVGNAGTVIYSATTDNTGNYTITGVSTGSYTVVATAATYDTGVTGAIVVSSTTTTVNFSLQSSPGIISGVVISDVTGLPISGALVEANLASIVVGSAVTDNSGNYTILGMTPGSYIVDAYATNYQTGTTGAIVVSEDVTTVDFSLKNSPGTISGTVISASGETPIVGALLEIIYNDVVIDIALTDSSGNYIITGVTPGSYIITASAATYDASITGAIVTANETTTVNFSLEPNPGIISGIVTSAMSGLPISGTIIEVSLDNTIVFSSLTDNSGNYIISGIAPGSYIVHAYATNYQTSTMGAIVTSNATTTTNFSLQSSLGTISGTITSETTGLPISGVLVEVNLSSIVIDSTVTDSFGNYTISGIAPGSYIVEAYATNYQTGVTGAIIVSGDTTTVNLSLESNPGIISGRIISAASGLPISGALIQIIHDDVIIDSTLTDSSGDYTISGVPSGIYTVDAYAANYQTATSSASISSNQTTTVNFSLQAGPGRISGTVISTLSGLPISGSLVEVNLDNTLIFSTLTDSFGNYSISGIAPNTYAVHAHAVTYQTIINDSVVVISNAATTVNFSLPSNPGNVQGVITDLVTGLPLSGVFIDIFENDVFINVAVTDTRGNYSITGLAADDYTLTASKTNYDSNDTSFMVTSGGTTTVNLTLTPNFPPSNLTGSVIINTFLLQTDRIHHLQWVSGLGGNITAYRLYRNSDLLAIISSNKPLEYNDHNRNANIADTYAVTAINTEGDESTALFITLQ
ncbi:MAG: carboxypeptidase regulatory-like domain-containing protein [Chlamydiales bacterium]|nr:carboxypeptidase regulatory-like domain-containing protein [Chlamydiales bacterium]